MIQHFDGYRCRAAKEIFALGVSARTITLLEHGFVVQGDYKIDVIAFVLPIHVYAKPFGCLDYDGRFVLIEYTCDSDLFESGMNSTEIRKEALV